MFVSFVLLSKMMSGRKVGVDVCSVFSRFEYLPRGCLSVELSWKSTKVEGEV